jgi:predicted secreted acid phosphatase
LICECELRRGRRVREAARMNLRRTLLVLAAVLLVALPATALAATKRTDVPVAQLTQQVDSGAYAKSVSAAWAKATKVLKAELAGKKGKKIRKPAVVLDIDETAMSNMGCLEAAGFELSGLATCVVNGESKAFPGARAFVKLAQKLRATVFYITGAPEAVCPARVRNLADQGFTGKLDVTCRPAGDTADTLVPYKSGARAAIEKRGYTIVLNVGDQRSDLAGGHSRKVVLVPNPVYISD